MLSSTERSREDGSDDESPKTGFQLEYIFDEVDPNTLLQAFRLQRASWPETTVEVLAWLIDLCKFARSYHGAYALMEMGTLSSLITNYFTFKAQENSSQSMLMVLLFSLCFRVQEAVHTARKDMNLYGLFFSKLLKHQSVSWPFLSKLNGRYEFNAHQLRELIPIVYSCFTQPLIENFVQVQDDNPRKQGFVNISLEVFDMDAFCKYRQHVEKAKLPIDTDQELETVMQKLETQLQGELGYSPTLSNMAIDCLEKIYSKPAFVLNVVENVRSTIQAFCLDQLGQDAASPWLYSLLKQFYCAKLLRKRDQSTILDKLWQSLHQYLQNDPVKDCTTLVLQLRLLKLMPRSCGATTLSLYKDFIGSSQLRTSGAADHCVWQLIAKDCPELVEGLDAPPELGEILSSE